MWPKSFRRWPVGQEQLYGWTRESHGYQGLPKGSVRKGYLGNQGGNRWEATVCLHIERIVGLWYKYVIWWGGANSVVFRCGLGTLAGGLDRRANDSSA